MLHRKVLGAGFALIFGVVSAIAQSPQLGAGQVLGNSTAAPRPSRAENVTAIFDRALGAVNGTTIYRSGGVWGTAAVGTSGHAIPFLDGTNTWSGGNNFTGALTLNSGPVVASSVQAFTLPQLNQIQSNINLPSIHRRPVATWLSKWGTARAKVLAGSANAKILVLGDSTTVGYAGVTAPTYPTSWPTVLSTLLTSAGLNSSWQSRISDGNGINAGTGLPAIDPRVVMGAYAGGVSTLAGSAFTNSSGTGTAFSFTPTTQVDSFDIYWQTFPGNGNMSIDINGGGATTLTGNAASALNKTTKTGSLATSTFHVTPTSPGLFTFFTAIVAYNSAVKEVSILNAGFLGGKIGDFNNSTAPYSALPSIAVLAPDLTIIDLTINDAISSTALSTYQTNLQAVITQALVSGDVIIFGGVPIATSSASLAAQVAVNNMAAAVAAKNQVNFISMFDLWGSRTAMIAAGYDAGDGVHLTASGEAAMAALFAPYIQ